jgi:integrin beta 2
MLQVQNLYDITVFENNLYVTSWRNQSIIRLDKFNSDDHETSANLSRPFAIHIFHRQRQPDGEWSHSLSLSLHFSVSSM